MKLLKKVLAATLVLSLTFACIPASAATTKVYNFENGKIPSGLHMRLDKGADKSKLSVKKFQGSKRLFIDVQNGTKDTPKLQFDVCKIVGAKNIDKIKSITFDVYVVSPNKKPIGWNGGGDGACNAKNAKDKKAWYQDPTQWVQEGYKDSQTSAKFAYKFAFVPKMGYTKGVKISTYLFMKWAGNENDMYIDNIKILDANGKAFALNK